MSQARTATKNSLYAPFNKEFSLITADFVRDPPNARGICMSRMRERSAAYERSEVKSSRRA